MKLVLFTALFILGSLLLNASQIPAWFLGGGKPTVPHWKIYGAIAIGFWLLMLILANTLL